MNVPILIRRNGGGKNLSHPIAEVRQFGNGESKLEIAVLAPESRFHDLFSSKESRFTLDFEPTSTSVIVRGQFQDKLSIDDIDRVFNEATIQDRFDAIFIDPSEVKQDGRGGSYDKWEHKIQLWVKSPPGNPPKEWTPDC